MDSIELMTLLSEASDACKWLSSNAKKLKLRFCAFKLNRLILKAYSLQASDEKSCKYHDKMIKLCDQMMHCFKHSADYHDAMHMLYVHQRVHAFIHPTKTNLSRLIEYAY